jgi:hypothetical protein
MRLVLVHGRSQEEKSEKRLREEWLPALAAGVKAAGLDPLPDDIDIRVPFYGKALVELITTPASGEVVSRGGGGRPDPVQAELLIELAKRAGVTDEEIAQELGVDVVPRGPANWEWVQAVARVLAKRAPWIADFALDRFLRDVDAYLTRPDVGRAVDDLVRPHVLGGPAVVVGHSLGSIVTYSILARAKAQADVPLFVTLGSPLGIPVVKRYLPRPLGMPLGVRKWVNGSDERDPVALHARLDRDTFPADIENVSDIHNPKDNPHGIAGYLNDGTVAKRIHAALAQVAAVGQA